MAKPLKKFFTFWHKSDVMKRNRRAPAAAISIFVALLAAPVLLKADEQRELWSLVR